ncbi:hypothetical protein EV363DRAFT_1270052 [Boletus edulis]|nr:hypothetical protein EV363DRAFT_1270052 [Boletus edulis]
MDLSQTNPSKWLYNAKVRLHLFSQKPPFQRIPYYRTMRDLADGRYYILPATPSGPPALPIGGLTDKSPSPVVVGGGDRLWTVKRLKNRNYTLTLEQFGPRFTEISGSDIVVDLAPSPQEWTIHERNDGTYTIELPSIIWPSRAWAVRNTKANTEVKIVAFEFPEHIMRWKFNPLIEETN